MNIDFDANKSLKQDRVQLKDKDRNFEISFGGKKTS